jgi:hypothetical protein
MRTKGHAMDTICYEVGCDLCCKRNSKEKKKEDNNLNQDGDLISSIYSNIEFINTNSYDTLSYDTLSQCYDKCDENFKKTQNKNEWNKCITKCNGVPHEGYSLPSPSPKSKKCKDCRCKDRIKLNKCDEYYDKYLKMLSEYQKSPTQEMLKRLNRLQIKISKCKRVSKICEKVSNELGKKCKSKICYINCERYYKEYMQSLKKFRKKDNNKTRKELYNKYVRLDKCRRAKIETSSGTDGWGSTPAQPTMDHLNGHGINNGWTNILYKKKPKK